MFSTAVGAPKKQKNRQTNKNFLWVNSRYFIQPLSVLILQPCCHFFALFSVLFAPLDVT